MASSSVLDRFLSSLADFVKTRDGPKLQDFLQIEPPLPPIYTQMVDELRQRYPADDPQSDAALLRRCEALVSGPRSKGGSGGSGASTWTAFPTFVKLYFTFLRDVNLENLLETYNLLKALVNQCVLALGDSQMGVIVLPTVLYLSKVLAKLAMGLDRRPELIAHLLRLEGGSEENVEKVTLVEKSANVVREAFIKCLTDRSGTPGVHGKPEGKRLGIYLMANLCLKLLFQCGKLRNAEQMFASISAQSPPLTYFPASQRVTYLYYLGRYLFSNNLFFPAQIALQAAYDQCHRQALKQRHLILTYLIPCNIIMGRFPSRQLLERPEAQGLANHFVPVCRLVARGDYIAFRQHLAGDSPATEWLARKGVLLPLRNRCEILVWRSLARKVFIHGGFHGDPAPQASRGPPPFLYLHKLEAAVRWLQSQHSASPFKPLSMNAKPGNQPSHSKYGSQIICKPADPDFAGLITNASPALPTPPAETAEDPFSKYADYLCPEGYFDAQGTYRANAPGTLVDGRLDTDYTSLELNPYPDRPDQGGETQESSPMMDEIESILASLLTQALMRGYLTHRNPRFAIPGARLKGALPTGFPPVWSTIYARERDDALVPGWVQVPSPESAAARANPFAAAVAGGRVVNLSGARPAGAQ
ncbi:hypothetical protein ASPZODRAFT_89964 [Penicilliopsis zonata CBS 506.65]|uniref:PCI domain-containing protein n=1 Tax=Penicilliopsis zonata CBS 506.65 TaxID=1073090 RepID=A0A1L9SSM5_9EURO|nr:hypothetical protein ASPZODRAFT_89964 [Penicilliopsis zonata CBS 506.65]OJJ50116.1 hypothetical protein ASPZODRAFT_89964 [Penicilliopsis zonata CBS 506.65]